MTQRRSAFITILTIALLTAATAALGAIISGGAEDTWYAALSKPSVNPPDLAFAIVWPILFTFMALGAVLVRTKAGSFAAASGALGLYFTQLAVNVSWSWLFFGFHQILLALIALTILWMLILAMIRSFAKHSIAAAVLQVPYFLWVSFAGYLNASILGLN